MRTIGILGGMGPAAGADFYARVVATHGAMRDQDHPPCVFYSATQVPDRTAHLLGDGPDPSSALADAAGLVERSGADFIAIPCNSAHAFLAAIRDAVSIPVLDMIALAVQSASERVPAAERVGVLAANGTVRVGLYDEPLQAAGREPVYPEADVQDDVMAAIRDVKSGATTSVGAAPGRGSSDPRFVAAAEHVAERGAECLIMGCTEVPLALAAEDCPVPAIDANQMLVDTTLGLATGRLDFDDPTVVLVTATHPGGPAPAAN